MGILNWLDKDLDNSLGNIFTGIAKGDSIFGGIVDGMRANRRDEELPNLIGQLPQYMRPTVGSIAKFAPDVVPELAMKQAQQDPRSAFRAVALRAATDPKIYGALKAKADAEGWGNEIDTPEKLQMFAYQGMKPEDAMPQRSQLGMTPIWGQDAQGNPVLLQLGQGQAVQAQLPPGVRLTPGVGMLNTGTGYVPFNQKTGATAGPSIPIDVAGKVQQETFAKDAAERTTQAPQTIRKAQDAMAVIDGILTDPNFNYGTGALGVVTRNIPGTPTFDFGQKIAQLQGQAFLQAFESLKGGGQITQIEGEKATAAIGRLNAAQSPEALKASLSELRGILQVAVERERSRIGNAPAPAYAPMAAPQSPETKQIGGVTYVKINGQWFEQ